MMRRLSLALLLLAACTSKRGATGWAAEVPADAVRYAEAPVAPPPVVVPEAPKVEAAAPPVPEKVVWDAGVAAPIEVTLWHAYRAAEKDALEKVIAAWNALGTKVTVKLRVVPFDAMNDKITVVVPEGRGPDLFIFAHDLVGAWSEMGFIEPLNTWTSEADTAQFLPATVGALVYKSALYGLPLAFKCVALYYNKAFIDAPPRDLEGLIAAAKKAGDGEGRYGLVYEAANLYFHAPWIHGYGAQVLTPDGKALIDSPEAVSALALAKRLVSTEKVTPTGITTAMVSGYFNDGKAAMAINGPWMRGEIAETVNYGVAPLPFVAEGQPARPYLGVEAVFLNKQASPEKKAAAFALARFLVSDASALIRFEVGKQPVANKAIWAGGGIDPAMQAFRDQAEQAVVMPSSPRMQQIWTPYNDALLSVISGDTSP
ncbi:MAG: extracellular solute-binding protein, partial [Myxococcales bacterium]|nr:extracellular solute-binding protein [Myxococcales bacterium]